MVYERHAPHLLIAILLLGLALRVAPWGHNRFLEDEALYAYWGLQIATGADPMLDGEPVDKPPLFPYVQALAFSMAPYGPPGTAASETTARLPSLLASITSIALLYALGRRLYDDVRVGLIAALLLAFSPFDILFASTAFTDPLMTALVLGALLAVVQGKWGLAGLLTGLSIATKQQALFFVPLIIAVGWLSSSPQSEPRPQPQHKALAWPARLWAQPWFRFGIGLLPVIIAIVWWDLARLQRPGFWEQSLISYGGLAPAETATLVERLLDWLELLGAFWVSPLTNALLAAALILWFALSRFSERIAPPKAVDFALLIYVAAYLLLHLLMGFQVWDRYLLALVPLVSLLAARALTVLGDAIQPEFWRRGYAMALVPVIVLLLAWPAIRAGRSQLPLGGDHGAYDGIDDLAAYMRDQAQPDSVLYHYWLGSHYRYYLYDAPLRLHWYPDMDDLAHDATVYRREPRYIAFASWRDGTEAKAALEAAGIHLVPEAETIRRDGSISFRLYRLEGP